MRTTKLYNVLSKNATVLATYVKEAAAIYEMNNNPQAERVECASTHQLIAAKPHAAFSEREVTVVYASPYYRDEYTEQWISDMPVERILEAARRRAKKNYLVFEIVGWSGTMFQI